MRYQSGTLPTQYTYTGQYSHTADFGLMFYVARWYDPVLGRFAQADSITLRPPNDPDNIDASNMFIALTVDFHETGFLNYVNEQNRNKLLSNSSLPRENDKNGNNQNESKSGSDNLLENLKQDDSSKLNADDYALQDFNSISQIENHENNSNQQGNNLKTLKLINTNTMDRYSYAKSCPTRYMDPSGHKEGCNLVEAGAGAFLGVGGALVTALGVVIVVAGVAESHTIIGILYRTK